MKKIILLLFVVGCTDHNPDRLVLDCTKSHYELVSYYDVNLKMPMTRTDTVCDQYEYRLVLNKKKYTFKLLKEIKD